MLEQALQDDDADLARRTSHSCVSTPHFDDALSTLARWAPTSDLDVELLIELLDASGTVRRFAGAALLDHSAVDDVSQDALISIAASIGSFQSTGKVTSWVHTIVRHRVVDHLRRQRATVPLEEDQSPAARMSSIIATKASVQRAWILCPNSTAVPLSCEILKANPMHRLPKY